MPRINELNGGSGATISIIAMTDCRAFHRPYAFDVHANSFFPLFLQLYVAQLLLAPVVTRSNWVCLFFGNTLYLSAVGHILSLMSSFKLANIIQSRR